MFHDVKVRFENFTMSDTMPEEFPVPSKSWWMNSASGWGRNGRKSIPGGTEGKVSGAGRKHGVSVPRMERGRWIRRDAEKREPAFLYLVKHRTADGILPIRRAATIFPLALRNAGR